LQPLKDITLIRAMPAASGGILACCGYKRPIPAGLNKNINPAGDCKTSKID
jgi:hypothetical protein